MKEALTSEQKILRQCAEIRRLIRIIKRNFDYVRAVYRAVHSGGPLR